MTTSARIKPGTPVVCTLAGCPVVVARYGSRYQRGDAWYRHIVSTVDAFLPYCGRCVEHGSAR